MKRTKQGVSLIVLVITIIVMIILAGAIILSLNNSGIIGKANEAVEKTNLKEVQNLAALVWAEAYMDGERGEDLKTTVKTALSAYEDDYDIEVTDSGVSVTKKDDNVLAAGLYVTDSDGNVVAKSWDDLITEGKITVSGTSITAVDTSLSGHLVVSDSITTIGRSAFFECDFESVTLPDSVTLIMNEAFNFTYIDSINLPNGITTIGYYAFAENFELTSITIPDSVTTIEESAFSSSTSLRSVTIGENSQLTSIGKYAFSGSMIENIELPVTVTNIGDLAFSSCTQLASIVYAGTVSEWNEITLGNDWNTGVPATYVQCSDGQVALT